LNLETFGDWDCHFCADRDDPARVSSPGNKSKAVEHKKLGVQLLKLYFDCSAWSLGDDLPLASEALPLGCDFGIGLALQVVLSA
jgi:hypothetical protein